MTSSRENKINNLLDRLRSENLNSRVQPVAGPTNSPNLNAPRPPARPPCLKLEMPNNTAPVSASKRPREINLPPKPKETLETDKKLKEIMKISGNLKINGIAYTTEIKDLEHMEELGNGTCGHVVKMKHKPSGEIIAVKQMRRSGNSEENKRIIMDIEVVIKSHDCPYIVQCLGCFITESEVWICMELMSTCFDKLLKRFKQAVPEYVIGKVTVATVRALSYLKETHGVIHRDVKPSNILLDERGNIKLCDFGISGRLVDSMAKTRSAGCAAYMAPERIEPDPNNPDYDIRADVWSLGITLVELATGVFPYQDCKTDFEVLTKVIGQDPPSLPTDREFSPEFRRFVCLCLTKDHKQRPKYGTLQNEPFIKKFEMANVNVGEWFAKALEQADLLSTKRSVPRHTPPLLLSSRRQIRPHDSYQTPQQSSLTNGSSKTQPSHQSTQCPSENSFISLENQHQPYRFIHASLPPDGRSHHISRLSTFQTIASSSSSHQRESHLPYMHQRPPDIPNVYNQSERSSMSPPLPHVRSYSPFRFYQNNLEGSKVQYGNAQDGDSRFSSHAPESRYGYVQSNELNSPYLQRRRENRWQSPSGSPLPLRNQQSSPENLYGNTSPIVLQRFYHQQKQQQKEQEVEEAAKDDPGKRRFASYIKLQLGGDRSGRSSRHQSPEPPPRLNRTISGENQSPLVMRRNFLESNSPALSRRYISPSPPVPPPRRLSESTSVPGSPQHFRARFLYTPEPQRRLYENNDISS